MDIKELQYHLDKISHEHNNRPMPEFEGYSPSEMHQILHDPFGERSPIRLNRLSGPEYEQIPMLSMVKYLAGLIEDAGEIKLTKKGFLPVKIVSDLYKQGFYKEYYIEKGRGKLYKEMDALSVHLTRILSGLAGLTKKRKGKLSLTKSSARVLADNHTLLHLLLATFISKFNWAYMDRYGENQIGQLGCGFSIILLSKYGSEKRLDTFYAEKYFRAFPILLEGIEPAFGTLKMYTDACYILRTFEIFLSYFGLVRVIKEGSWLDSETYIQKASLLHRLVKYLPPQNR